MNASAPPPNWGRRVWALIQELHALDPARYREQWLPYIQGTRRDWGFPLANLYSIEELERGAELIPFATFAFYISYRGAEGAHLARQLADSPLLSHVSVLDLRENHIHGDTVLALSSSPHTDKLTALSLQRTSLRAVVFLELITSTSFPKLEHLNLSDNHLKDARIYELAHSPLLDTVTMLELSNTRMGDHGLTALAHNKHLARIHTLDVSRNNISDDACEALARAQRSGPSLPRPGREPDHSTRCVGVAKLPPPERADLPELARDPRRRSPEPLDEDP